MQTAKQALLACAILVALYVPAALVGFDAAAGPPTELHVAEAAGVVQTPTAAVVAEATPTSPATASAATVVATVPAPPPPPPAEPPAAERQPEPLADEPTAEPPPEAEAPQPPVLPLEHNQMIVFYGSPLASGLGILGMFEPEEAAERVQAQAAMFDELNGDRGALPAFDLIYAMAMDEPTANGLYLRYLPDRVVQRYIDVAERHDLQLILDLQIGRGNVADEVRKIERFLKNPRVHVAIDPEYAVGPHGAPIKTPGRITGHDLNEIQQYVDDLVSRNNLPPKLVVVHQYMDSTIKDGDVTASFPNVDLVLNMDAFGPTKAKVERYHHFSSRPYARRDGFNIFLKQDDRVMSEQEVLEISPEPDMVFYQ